MAGPTDPGAPPPEVPDEFAEAYRAAYAEALRAQPEHHPDVESTPESAAPASTMPTWLIPALAALALLVVVLLLIALLG